MLAQVVGAPSSSGLGELGPGVAGSTLAVLLLLVASLVVLRVVYSARRGRRRPGGPLAVLAQVELAPGQSLYVVRAAGRCLLVGGTSGGLGLIAELDPAQVAATAETPSAPLGVAAGTLAQLRARLFSAAEPPTPTVDLPFVPAEPTAPPGRHADLKVS